MLRGLYSSAAAMNAAATHHDVVSRNLAHVNVPGFKRSHVSFESLASTSHPNTSDNIGANARTETDFTPGAFERTGRPLDLAIEGDGFFTLDGPDGPLFTRNGSFHRTDDGQLVTSSGYPVAGSPTIPPDVADADIQIAGNGEISVNGNVLGQLEIAGFTDNSRLRSVGTTLFAAPPAMPPGDSDARVQQGTRERSNVNSVIEMVQMLAGMRHHEASSKALQAIAEAVEKHTSAN